MAKKKMAKKRAPSVDAERFCKAYKEVADKKGSVGDVAAKLGIPVTSVVARRGTYAKNYGLKFPKLERKKRLDVDKLKKILAGHPL